MDLPSLPARGRGIAPPQGPYAGAPGGSEEESGCRAQGRANGEERQGPGVPHPRGRDKTEVGGQVEEAPSCPPPDVPAGPLLTPQCQCGAEAQDGTELSPAADAARSSKAWPSEAPASDEQDGRVGRRPSRGTESPRDRPWAGGRASLPGSVQTPRGHRVRPGAWPYLPGPPSPPALCLRAEAHMQEKAAGRGHGLGAGQPGTPGPASPGWALAWVPSVTPLRAAGLLSGRVCES